MDHHRRDAKAFLRAFRDGHPDAGLRAERALGARAHARFLLSDAQHVVASEQGYRTWLELKRATERDERVVDTGLEYGRGDPVRVRVVRRGTRAWVSDGAAGAARAGRTRVPDELARRIEREFVVNVSRCGDVGLPGERFVERIARASLALYQELLDLE